MADQKDQQETPTNGIGCLVRLYWMAFGNALFLFLLLGIFDKRAAFGSWLDAFYWLAVAAIILVRYADVRFFHGLTGEGKPATMRDWRRYSLIIAGVAGAAWLLCHLILHLRR